MKTGQKLPLAILMAAYAVAYDHPIAVMIGFGLLTLIAGVIRKIIVDPDTGGND